MATGTVFRDDPNVKIPAAVRMQAERADAIIAQMNGEQPLQQEEQPASELSLTAAPVNQPAPAAEPQPDGEDTTWEHKYKSLHGRVTALTGANSKLSEQVGNLQNVIAAMTAAVPEQPSSELSFEDVSAEDSQEYGEDLLRVVGVKAMKQLEPVLKQMQDRIDQQAQTIRTLTGKTVANERVSVLDALTEWNADWETINVSDEFVAWLALPDAFSGAIRHNMLKEAFAAGNAPRVLAFFKGFLKDEAATNLHSAVEPDPAATRVAKIPLAELAAPGKAKAAPAAPAQPDKPIITRAQIASFYADVNAGKYKGRDADKNSAEAMIFSAQRDGRIR